MCALECNYSRYLIFIVGSDEYAMPIDRIREIIGYVPIIPFSKKQGVFQGIIAWRKDLLPVVDLRRTISDSDVQTTSQTCILIVGMPVDGEMLEVGVVVDGVCEILEVGDSLMEEESLDLSAYAPRLSWGSLTGRPSSVFVDRRNRFGRY